ncbi:L,D-transpeptidase family protein [Roseisolibacter agri]|nr:L,D-transpeptidase [Roseisolibacter agri]
MSWMAAALTAACALAPARALPAQALDASAIGGGAATATLRAPLGATSAPEELLQLQTLLDAAGFAPGSITAKWGDNTRFAVRAFRAAQGLSPADEIDADAYARLAEAAGAREPLTSYTLTAADVRGPYRKLPAGTYAKARLDCLCYQSLLEMLGERFHVAPDVLRRLNPDVSFASAAAGTQIVVPNVARRSPAEVAPRLARMVVDRREGSLRGEDAAGRTLFWMPVSVGSPEEPSPSGRLKVVSITRDPHYHFNPRVLGDVPDSRPDAHLPPGPNSPVGVLWMQLSKAHVGIHGTAEPELVGPGMSHGCVRVTNWDARWLASVARPGLEVHFL